MIEHLIFEILQQSEHDEAPIVVILPVWRDLSVVIIINHRIMDVFNVQ